MESSKRPSVSDVTGAVSTTSSNLTDLGNVPCLVEDEDDLKKSQGFYCLYSMLFILTVPKSAVVRDPLRGF